MKLSISIALLKMITPNKITSEYFCNLCFEYIKRRIYNILVYIYSSLEALATSMIYPKMTSLVTTDTPCKHKKPRSTQYMSNGELAWYALT